MQEKYLYKRIIELRERKDYTQTEVARLLNISQRAYSHYENGTRQLPLEILCKLADLYGVSTDFILDRTNHEEPYPRH